IRINGEMISQQAVVEFVEKHRAFFEKKDLSFFEMTVGLAFDYFAKQKVDVAIIETGMGGRLDSTNLIQPILSVITNIGLDHVQYLGSDLQSIAKEKAGIIKNGVPVVIGQTQAETKPVFEAKAAEAGAPIVFADRVFDANRVDTSDKQMQVFDIWKNSELFIEQQEIPLLGHYQQKNLITAICAVDMLLRTFQIDLKDIRGGIETVVRSTGLSGRWQVISRNPLAIADTGHNVDGIKEVVFQLRLMQFNQLHFVLGMVNDKSIEAVLNLLPRHATYYFCKADIPRGLDANVLAEQAFELGLRGRVYESVRSAYFSALNAARPDDLVFVGGSTFVVAEVV
ncbi:MAG TPA: Mur ligase family protein, partial [Bacteroidales bacterium]|nr:Mur ligase family protein [Bacteroidales bacterium]